MPIEYSTDLKELIDELDEELDDLDDAEFDDIEDIVEDIINEAYALGYNAAIDDSKGDIIDE